MARIRRLYYGQLVAKSCAARRETNRKNITAPEARNLVISELQFKSAATYFLLRAITPAPENYH